MTEATRIDRPHVVLSVATSIDGFIDDAGPERLLLSNDADFDRVDQVRAESDAILLGAGAIRSDNPRVVVRDTGRRVARTAAGRPEHPLKVTITGSGNLDPDLRWFHTGGERVVYTTETGAMALNQRIGDVADIVPLGPEVGLAAVVDDLGDRGVERLMVEGGTQVNTALLADGLVDELHVAVTPLLVGAGPRIVDQATYPWPSNTRWNLAETTVLGDVVVLRYLVDRSRVGDVAWLERAVALAERCPPSDTAFSVGACIVGQDGAELSTGYSRETDQHVHAEESALAKLTEAEDLTGATIYSSLEPCGARASRPTPCANLIIESGIKRVVMAWTEPSDFVDAPEGIAVLRNAGVEVLQLPVGRPPNYRPTQR